MSYALKNESKNIYFWVEIYKTSNENLLDFSQSREGVATVSPNDTEGEEIISKFSWIVSMFHFFENDLNEERNEKLHILSSNKHVTTLQQRHIFMT